MSARYVRPLLHLIICVFWDLRSLKYNTVELCMYLHAYSVCCANSSILRHKGIITKIKSYFFKIIEIMSSTIKTCSYDRQITKWLYMNNSYLALLTWSCKADCHIGLKKSTWHDCNHVQDSGFKGISRKDETMLNRIGLVSDLLWHLFLDSLSEIFVRCQAYESMCQKSAAIWHKTITAIARSRIPHRENELPTSYLHRFNFCTG